LPSHPAPAGGRDVILIDGAEYVLQPVITTNLEVVITGGRNDTDTCRGLDFPAPDAGTD
jgi:hypothetical protein